ncbi:hypothetical protein [Stenotrophomonas geniculata]|jgi:hypothetical protein|uniref:hypothetical protein n=1 Tax=Stenotrophomonas geniculata TaxID=86188 RepID=UPI002E78AED6|nr:hypothetical protein [Stenotrophomonas geniculata]
MSSHAQPKIWNNCMAITFQEGESCIYTSCNVKLDSELLVEYADEGEIIQYRGINDGTGHFLLKCANNGGAASLHLAPNTALLQGSWVENGMNGMWKILLKD